MDRRDALKALAGVVAGTGMTVSPITAQESKDVALVVLKAEHPVPQSTQERILAIWNAAVDGTPLQGVRVVLFDDSLSVEFVRK
jgi:hypothetical protein